MFDTIGLILRGRELACQPTDHTEERLRAGRPVWTPPLFSLPPNRRHAAPAFRLLPEALRWGGSA